MGKYAIYVVVVEDNEEADMAIVTGPYVETGERVKGGLDFDEAEDAVADILSMDLG